MGMIAVERGEEQHPPHTCTCCGNLAHSSYGFIYSDGDAHAVYFARWTEGHEQTGVTMLITLGEWGDDEAGPESRKCMALRAWLKGGEVVFTVLSAAETDWAEHESSSSLGMMLSREQALADVDRAEFFHLAEHVVDDDPAVRAFVDRARDIPA